MTIRVYHIQSKLSNIIQYLHQNIEEKYSMEKKEER